MNPLAILWFVLMCVFLAAEAGTVSLVSVWFAAGSLASLVVSLIGGELWLQGVVFFVVSIVSLAALRPILRKYFNPKLQKTNVDAIVGATGKVIVTIDNIQATGQVKIGGMEWTARSSDGQPIEEGTIVTVDKVEGVKVYVSMQEVPAEIS